MNINPLIIEQQKDVGGMELWFTENHTPSVKLSMKIHRQVVTRQSRYQRIDVLDSLDFGRVLTLDGCLMLTEKDEFIYHEMIVHPAMAVSPDVRHVLVIGAGDGGTIRELCRYHTIETIHMAEIDPEVVAVCREYLPQTACSLGDPRLSLHYVDGLKFVRERENYYDLIIVDSTDPFGPGEGLFTKEFYGNCFRALNDSGILINQHESPYYPGDAIAMQRAHQRIRSVFPVAMVYQAHIPTYPSGHWMFGFASKGVHPVRDLEEQKILRWQQLQLKTRYYNTKLHKGAFALPNYVLELLAE